MFFEFQGTKGMRILVVITLLLAFPAVFAADALKSQAAPNGAKVYIVSPKDGDVVASPVTVIFGLKGMGIAPAGVERPNTGHHHLMINAPAIPPADQAIPANEYYKHFGLGQTETEMELNPGKYTLQLLLGDNNHVPFNPPLLSEPITITVKAVEKK